MDNGFSFHLPTKLVYGADCLKKAEGDLALGEKALIVTGRSSARLSGALDDLLAVLKGEYFIFDQVENNPAPETVRRGGEIARREGCDYVVAIGGGSPLDAAKVIAVLAVNDLHPLELYKKSWKNRALPIAAIPTTAGTGSEVTQYAVLTLAEEQTKKGIGGADLFPRISFLDPKYTASLPLDITVDTAVDALSHLIEGYLCKRATAASDLPALQGIALWGTAMAGLKGGDLGCKERQALLLASCLGGITIAQTGTALVHALGYSLTYFQDFPHGRANGVLLEAYLRYTEKVAPQRVATVLELLDLDSVDEFGQLMRHFFGEYLGALKLGPAELASYAAKAALTNNVVNSTGDPCQAQLTKILEESMIG